MRESGWKVATSMLGVACCLLAGYAQANPPSRFVNTSHDLRSFGVPLPNDEMCRPCHTPHNSLAGQPALWNHRVDTAKVYSLYSASNPATAHNANYVGLDQASKLCLSCHDGTIAVDSFGGATGKEFITGRRAVGRDGLGNDHPIGLTYPGLNGDGTWNPSAAAGYSDPNAEAFTAAGVEGGPGIKLVSLPGTTVKGLGCTTCHVPHDTTQGKFRRISNAQSGLCLRCHQR